MPSTSDNKDLYEQWSGVAKASDGQTIGSAVLHESGVFMLTAGHVIESLDLEQASISFEAS